MRLRTIALVAAVALAAPVPAMQGGGMAGAKDPARVTGGSYTVDSGHTLVGWRVSHFGFSDYFGIFGDATGTLTLDPGNLSAASVDITIPVGKVTTASAGLTRHLLKAAPEGGKPDFFGANPPDARFVSKKVAASGTGAVITGDLTLNGVTREVTLNAEFTGAGIHPYSKKENIGFSATGTIVRSEFGIVHDLPYNVSDKVELDISVAFTK